MENDESTVETSESVSDASEPVLEVSEGTSEGVSTVSESPSIDYTQILQSIDDRLANLEGIQTDTFSAGFDLFWVAMGLFVGVMGAYILTREALKRWER